MPVVVVALVVGILVLLATQLHPAEHDLTRAYQHFSWDRLPWLLLAVGAEAVSFLCYAMVQRLLLQSGGARLTRRTMVALAVGATGLTNLVPGGTAPASGWLVGQYRRRDVPMPLALWAVLAGGYAATVSILFILLVGSGIAGLLAPWAFLVCALALITGAVGVVVGVHHLSGIESWLARHRAAFELRLVRRVAETTARVAGFRTSVPRGTAVLALSLANWAMDVFVLVGAFGLLGLPIPWRAVLFAYAAAQVAGSLAPLPGGIGFVEGGMIGAFTLTGSGVGAAILATIVYRAITCWLVAAVGSLMLAILSHRPPGPPAELEGRAAELSEFGSAPSSSLRVVHPPHHSHRLHRAMPPMPFSWMR